MTSEFGNHFDDDTAHYTLSGRIRAIVSTPTSNGNVYHVSMKLINESGYIKAALYSYTGISDAGSFIAETDTKNIDQHLTATWQTLNFTTPPAIVSGTSYFITVKAEDSKVISLRLKTGTDAVNFYKTKSFDDAFEDPMTGETSTAIQYCIYATYEPTGSTEYTATKIKKGVIRYTGTNNAAENTFMAEHFDLLDLPMSKTATVQAIKTINPDIKAVGYWDMTSLPETYAAYTLADASHEQWFMHDKYDITPDADNRVRTYASSGYWLYAMMCDPTIAPDSWADYYAVVAAALVTDTANAWDGVFVDEVFKYLFEESSSFNSPEKWHTSYIDTTYGGRPIHLAVDATSDLPSTTTAHWAADCLAFCQNLQAKLNTECPASQQLAVLNCWKWTDLATTAGSTDFVFWESFIHGRSLSYDNVGYGLGYDYGKSAIDVLHAAAVSGATISVSCGCLDADAHPTEAACWQDFTLGCFMFTVEDLAKAYYFWQFWGDDNTYCYFSNMDLDFGTVVDDYYLIAGIRTFAREFTNYYVIVNLSITETTNVEINGEWFVLLPRRARFIPKGGAPQPPPPPQPPSVQPVPEPAGPCTFVLQTITGYWELNLPETLIYADGRSVNRLNLWASNFVSDAGKLTENITLTGYTNDKGALNLIDVAMDRGDEIQINGFDIDNIDGTWLCESFKYGRSGPGRYSYSLTLERVR